MSPLQALHTGAVNKPCEFLSAAEIQRQLIGRLKYEKSQLISALGDQLIDNPDRVIRDFGARGKYGCLSGVFEINCGRDGFPQPKSGCGTGAGLKHFQWIPIVYREEDSGTSYSYLLSLFQEDLDVSTGNFHQNFFGVQLTRTSGQGLEIGAESCALFTPINLETQDVVERCFVDDEISLGPLCPNACLYYSVLAERVPGNSFPRALRGLRGLSVNSDTKPFGYQYFEDEIPCLDFTSEDYNPADVGRFMMKLIHHDIVNQMLFEDLGKVCNE